MKLKSILSLVIVLAITFSFALVVGNVSADDNPDYSEYTVFSMNDFPQQTPPPTGPGSILEFFEENGWKPDTIMGSYNEPFFRGMNDYPGGDCTLTTSWGAYMSPDFSDYAILDIPVKQGARIDLLFYLLYVDNPFTITFVDTQGEEIEPEDEGTVIEVTPENAEELGLLDEPVAFNYLCEEQVHPWEKEGEMSVVINPFLYKDIISPEGAAYIRIRWPSPAPDPYDIDGADQYVFHYLNKLSMIRMYGGTDPVISSSKPPATTSLPPVISEPKDGNPATSDIESQATTTSTPASTGDPNDENNDDDDDENAKTSDLAAIPAACLILISAASGCIIARKKKQ